MSHSGGLSKLTRVTKTYTSIYWQTSIASTMRWGVIQNVSFWMSINHPHTHIYPTDTLWHWKDSFQRLTQHSKKKALNLESGVPSIFLSHFYLNFSMRFIYIRNVTKAFSGLEAFIGSSLHWLAVYSVKSWYKYTFFFTEFIDKTFYVFASWTWDKSSIERPQLIPVYLTNTPLSDWR